MTIDKKYELFNGKEKVLILYYEANEKKYSLVLPNIQSKIKPIVMIYSINRRN
jgi:hypothetical protein